METIKKIFKFLSTVIVTVFLGITAIFLFGKNKDIKKEAEEKKEEKKNELQKKSADDIAADSPNPDAISSNIKHEQDELRKRVRDRLNQNL